MVNKKSNTLIIFLLMTIGISFLHAQDFYVERRFIQRLSWSGNEYALRYEVIIEKEEGGEHRRVYQEFSTAYNIEVSLPPGRYRYRVIPYNFLNRPGAGTEWVDFEIYAALHPQLYYAVPELYLSGEARPVFSGEYVLMIYGMNIAPHAEIFLRRENGTIINPSETRVFPDRTAARLVFPEFHVIPRSFDVVVRNPGDFEAILKSNAYIATQPDKESALLIFEELGSIPDSLLVFFGLVVPEPEPEPEPEEKIVHIPSVQGYRASKWYLSFALAPVFSMYETLLLQPEATTGFPSGEFKLGFIRSKKDSYFGLGLESSISWFSFNAVYSENIIDYYYVPMQAITVDISLAAQKRTYNEKMAFMLRFGIGRTFLRATSEIIDETISSLYHLNMGASFKWLAGKSFFMETGIDMLYWFSGEESSGAIRPFAGLGWRF